LGLVIGTSTGLFTGISVGWSKKTAYWIQPIIKILGPIPATAWIPIALTAFPTSFAASIFMVSLSVWFPVTVLSSSGVQNIEAAYFEVAKTLGASNTYQIFKIALPGAMPSIFVGLFNGVCASFISLMSAEMLGVKFGLGWYINWQREVMSYANVYAGLILIAFFCYFFITVLFKFRDKLLIWQKGIIKW
jgi:NitT/TauT family transport system permease protein